MDADDQGNVRRRWLISGQWASHAKEAMFFFEKKNQKTFAPWHTRPLGWNAHAS
jgi:hypothetical protein